MRIKNYVLTLALVVVTFVLLFFTLRAYAQTAPTLTPDCQKANHSNPFPDCDDGEIQFTGQNFAAQVHVYVTADNTIVMDDWAYNTHAGVLQFTENFSFVHTYRTYVDGVLYSTIQTEPHQ